MNRSWIYTLRLLIGALLCYGIAMLMAGKDIPALFAVFLVAGGVLEICFWADLFTGRSSRRDALDEV